MVANITISLLAIVLGSLGMLLLLLMWFGGMTIEPEPESAIDPILDPKDQATIYDMDGPFIPIPDHLKTADEMVAWMIRDMPRLTAEAQKPRR
ncbi:hypothetical protein DC522_08095 [Microvirga sp. KLBC 81]|uniref:hypothetical protein n=1 Tax=Microvirga sp. KLBC 81 TaxID=1862707 RepID=UPI000D5089FD|nr:hypothetical protein [Microvirga sp. KLBC 81]PVE24874.1 hypothetical protein DC522_08095 [Microvirga sp. KLBC 81]